ncbi:MAG: DUF72 domain-containing protein [Cytophagales bacterium]|nr:DUF72 domain-containing protein [Cytophagales bacterium]MDW8383223.1 DUF72 domain-containing protein [Flammeovirgaceae bacterium]
MLSIYLGSTGWANPEWKGILYPPKAKSNEFLRYYSQQFDAIELNATHYQIPTEQQINNWKSAVFSHFRFCPKMPQKISQYQKLAPTQELELFYNRLSLLKEKIGILFIQLPPEFSPAELPRLKNFFSCRSPVRMNCNGVSP